MLYVSLYDLVNNAVKHKNINIDMSKLSKFDYIHDDIVINLAVWLHKLDSCEAYKVLRHLQSLGIDDIDEQAVAYTTQLISYHRSYYNTPFNFNTSVGIKRLLRTLGQEQLFRLIKMEMYFHTGEFNVDKVVSLSESMVLLNKIISNNECYRADQLAVNREDLIESNIKQEHIGCILDTLLDMVVFERIENNKEELLRMSKVIDYNMIHEF